MRTSRCCSKKVFSAGGADVVVVGRVEVDIFAVPDGCLLLELKGIEDTKRVDGGVVFGETRYAIETEMPWRWRCTCTGSWRRL